MLGSERPWRRGEGFSEGWMHEVSCATLGSNRKISTAGLDPEGTIARGSGIVGVQGWSLWP